jgi:hypothetical protein
MMVAQIEDRVRSLVCRNWAPSIGLERRLRRAAQ